MDGFRRAVYVNAAVILGSFAIFLGAIWVVGQGIHEAGTRLVDQFSSYFNQSYAAERLLSLKQLEPQAQDLQRKMEILLPVQDQLLNFPDFVKSIADAKQVQLSFNFNSANIVSPNSGPGSIAFTLTASGPLQNTQNFLDALESKTQRFWVGIDSVDFLRNGDSYTLTAQGKVFFRQ